MGWIRRQADEVPADAHRCQPPMRPTVVTSGPLTGPATTHTLPGWDVPDANLGDLWQCDTCATLWRCCYLPLSGTGGYEARAIAWRRAGWLTRLRYPT